MFLDRNVRPNRNVKKALMSHCRSYELNPISINFVCGRKNKLNTVYYIVNFTYSTIRKLER